MAIEWSTSAKENVAHGVKVLVWGDSGLGKTVLCATAPTPIIISAEQGLLSLNKQNLQKIWTPAQGMPINLDIPVIKVRTVLDVKEAYDWVATSPHAAGFQTVCIDSITEIAETVLANAKATVKDPRQAYGELLTQMETVIKMFRDLPGKNVYMSAKMEPQKDELTGMTRYGPAMPGSKLGPKLPYYFDEVFQLAINKTPDGKEFRYLRTRADLQNVAKDRSGTLDAMEMPHLTNVFNKILQGV